METKKLSRFSRENLETAIGIIIIGLLYAISVYFVYINEPIGDDILGMFDGGLSGYLEEFDGLGTRITSLHQVIEQLKTVYLYWSGRMPGYTIMLIGRLLPRFATSIITAAINIGICILALKILYEDIRKGLRHILCFVIIYLAVYWYKTDLYFTYMWTMTGIYSTAVFWCLAYYVFAFSNQEHRWDIRSKRFWGLQILGLVAGWSHEVLSLTMIAIVGIRWIIDVRDKKVKWYNLFMHTGLGVGYLLGFFAPGNFNRMRKPRQQSSLTILMRMYRSVRGHKNAVISPSGEMRLIFGVIVVLAIFALIRLMVNKGMKESITLFLKKNLPFIGGGLTAGIAWGLVNRVPGYGMDLWVVIVYLTLFQTINLGFEGMRIDTEWIQSICGLLLTLGVIAININEVAMYTEISTERRNRIREAVENNQEEVLVPAYPDTLPSYRYELSYLNGQEHYDTEYYREYYGIHIIIDNEE